jgi:hypothetical protein
MDRECISKPVKWFLSQNGQKGSLLVFWPHSMFGQNHLCVTMLHMDSTIQKCFRVRRFSVPSQSFGWSSHPVRTTCHTVWTPDRPSIIRPDDMSLHLDPLLCRERFYLACIRSDVSAARPDASQYSISSRKGRSINRPDDVVSRPDARLLKARIAIQISPSRRLTAVVRTRVYQRRKFPIRLQPSGRLPIMVRTRALQIWKLRVEE